MKYKYASLFTMGNKYKIMADITLTYRLFKDVEENSKEFTVEVNTQDLILDLQDKIYEEVKKSNNDFLEIEANDLKLWKVEINNGDNDAFSSLVLPNDNAKSLDKLKEKIVDYWDDEEKRPKEGCTHIIINSPRVIERRLIRDKDEQIREKNGEINELCEEFDRLMTKGGPNILKNAYKIGKIKIGDEVRYGKDHVCFLSAIGSVPYITYDKTKYYSINTFL